MARIRAEIQTGFPNLDTSFRVTSEDTPAYNCIAWAAGDTSRWWWPLYPYYWPNNSPRALALGAFVEAFATLGYVPRANSSLEHGKEKVVIFVRHGLPTHMARQMLSGAWSSKLGESWDIGHFLPAEVGGDIYGDAVEYLWRPRT